MMTVAGDLHFAATGIFTGIATVLLAVGYGARARFVGTLLVLLVHIPPSYGAGKGPGAKRKGE